MADYRAYIVGNDGHFESFRAFVCNDDSDAVVWAKQLVDGHDVELWSGERFIITLSKKLSGREKAAPPIQRK
jgi:hypothetical protein